MERAKDIIAKFRNKGLKITPQRIAIFKSLGNRSGHPSAEDVYRQIRQDYPSISLTTVYKTLQTLCEMGELSEIHVCKERVFYDPISEPHHHMICLKCSRIQNIPASCVRGLKMLRRPKSKFHVINYQVRFGGYCGRCKRAATP